MQLSESRRLILGAAWPLRGRVASRLASPAARFRVTYWLAVIVKAADSKAWVYKRVSDGILQSPLSSASTVSLTNGNWYTGKVVVGDDKGSMTDDGIFKFAYDAWNRLVLVKSRYTARTTQTTFATYSYDGANRRNSKVVVNSGVEVYPNDGGNMTVHFYYGSVAQPPSAVSPPWSIFETRNGSSQTAWQHLWGTQYIDELIWLERNGDPTIGNDTDPDGTVGEASESPADHRYFAHQDRNWNVVGLTDYGAGMNGEIVERYVYRSYGTRTVSKGESSGGECAGLSGRSVVGNVFGHQGLFTTSLLSGAHSRRRDLTCSFERWLQRDPIGPLDGVNLYECVRQRPTHVVDRMGLYGQSEPTTRPGTQSAPSSAPVPIPARPRDTCKSEHIYPRNRCRPSFCADAGAVILWCNTQKYDVSGNCSKISCNHYCTTLRSDISNHGTRLVSEYNGACGCINLLQGDGVVKIIEDYFDDVCWMWNDSEHLAYDVPCDTPGARRCVQRCRMETDIRVRGYCGCCDQPIR